MTGLKPVGEEFDERLENPCRIMLIGLGGGGSNAVANMASGWKAGPEVVLVNTDTQALAACGGVRAVAIGRHLTRGFGAGGDPAVGKLAAEEEADVLRELMAGMDVVFLVVTLGGGTGTGAAPVLARLAREAGATLIAFAALPFDFEGLRRRQQAREGLQLLRLSADIVVTLSNEHLFSLVDDQASLLEAFGQTDAMLGTAVHSLWKLLTGTGIINLDLTDLRHMVEHSEGACAFGYAEATGPDKAAQAAARLLAGPLLNEGDTVARAEALLVDIVGDPELTLREVHRIVRDLTARAPADVRLFMGAGVEESWTDKVAVVVLAAENWSSERAPDERNEPGERSPARPGRAVQPELVFDPQDKGRFKGVDPTVYQGEDLDIPTYLRRGLKLSFEK